jgi:5-methylcytosine-specific restriction enzyme subunit McrC
MARLRKALIRLEDVGHPLRSDISPAAIARFIGRLPSHHEHYADALMVAQLFILDIGLSIRGSGEIAILPSILINMAKVFEDYIRHILSIGLVNDIGVSVRNGNKGGDGGAKLNLFDPVRAGFKNPPVTPDIVIDVNGKPSLIIDVKYKPSPMVPERDDTNQVVLYGARYASTRVMLVHSDRPAYRPNLEFCGNVGDFRVYNGMIDLNAADIELEEFNFIKSIRDIIT